MRLILRLAVQLAVLLPVVTSVAATDWKVSQGSILEERLRSIREARDQKLNTNSAAELEEIRRELYSQGINASMVDIKSIDPLGMDDVLDPNSPYRIEAIRNGTDPTNINRYYMLGMRDASISNPDLNTYAVVLRAKFTFESGLRNLKIKRVDPRLYFAEKEEQ
ncbi:MAG: hypothetical protein V4692_15950 [Bdellovibrionota bacterium]